MRKRLRFRAQFGGWVRLVNSEPLGRSAHLGSFRNPEFGFVRESWKSRVPEAPAENRLCNSGPQDDQHFLVEVYWEGNGSEAPCSPDRPGKEGILTEPISRIRLGEDRPQKTKSQA